MVRNFVMACLVLVFTAALVYAIPVKPGELVGKWTGTVEAPTGNKESTLTFTLDGDKLIGEAFRAGGNVPLDNVALADNGTLTWSVVYSYYGEEYVLTFSGTLDGKKIVGNYDLPEYGLAPYNASKIEEDTK
jgi:hypothetical protein